MRRSLVSLLIIGAGLVVVATGCAPTPQAPAVEPTVIETPEPTPTPEALAVPPTVVQASCDELVPAAIRAQAVDGTPVLDDGDPVEESWDAVVRQAGQTRCGWNVDGQRAIDLALVAAAGATDIAGFGPGTVLDTLGRESAYLCTTSSTPKAVVDCSGMVLVGDVLIDLWAEPTVDGDATAWFVQVLTGLVSTVENAPAAPAWVAVPTVAAGAFDTVPTSLLIEAFGALAPVDSPYGIGGLDGRDGSAYKDAGLIFGSWVEEGPQEEWIAWAEILPGGAWAASPLTDATRPASETDAPYEPAVVPGLDHAMVASTDESWSAQGAYGSDLVTVSVSTSTIPDRDAFITAVGKFLAGLPRA